MIGKDAMERMCRARRPTKDSWEVSGTVTKTQQVRRGESENQTQTRTHNESDDGDDDDADGPRHVRVGGEGETLPTEDHREGEEHDEGGAVDQPEYQREVVSASVNGRHGSYMRTGV